MDTIVEAFTLWGKYGPFLGVGLIIFYIVIGIIERVRLTKYEREKTDEENESGFRHNGVHH